MSGSVVFPVRLVVCSFFLYVSQKKHCVICRAPLFIEDEETTSREEKASPLCPTGDALDRALGWKYPRYLLYHTFRVAGVATEKCAEALLTLPIIFARTTQYCNASRVDVGGDVRALSTLQLFSRLHSQLGFPGMYRGWQYSTMGDILAELKPRFGLGLLGGCLRRVGTLLLDMQFYAQIVDPAAPSVVAGIGSRVGSTRQMMKAFGVAVLLPWMFIRGWGYHTRYCVQPQQPLWGAMTLWPALAHSDKQPGFFGMIWKDIWFPTTFILRMLTRHITQKMRTRLLRSIWGIQQGNQISKELRQCALAGWPAACCCDLQSFAKFVGLRLPSVDDSPAKALEFC